MTSGWPTAQPVIAGEGVVLRPWRTTDADAVFRACQDEAIQHFTRVPVPYRQDHAEFFVVQGPRLWESRAGAAFAVVDGGSDDDVLGSCGLVEVDASTAEGVAGYWVAPWARGRGVARAALGLLSEWALGAGGLTRLTLEVEGANPASAAVAVAAGFRRTGEPVVEEMKGTERQFLTYERLPA
jgi:RimJ/RimL family protein N-acetyltransferase